MALLADMITRGLMIGPKPAIGDGALGSRKALGRNSVARSGISATGCTRRPNVLNRRPRTVRSQRLRACYKRSGWRVHGRETRLTFYDFRAAPVRHIRATNPIESTFATVRLRTAKSRGCGSDQSILSLVCRWT